MENLEPKTSHEPDAEATAVSPLFDDEATVVAQPVVPLDDKAVTDDVETFVQTGTAPPAYERAWRRRTHWTVALVLVGLVLGTIAGIMGLRLYQKSRAQDSAEDVSQQPASEQPALTGDALPAPTSQPANENATTQGASEDAGATVGESAATERAPETAGSASADEQSGVESATKRGKKGEGEAAEVDEPVESAEPGVFDTQGPAPEGSEAARRAAREEERLRRARRERRGERRGRPISSIREIFEGGTESPPR